MKKITKTEKNKTIEAIRVPHGYRDEYIGALEGHHKYVSNGIPRYNPTEQASFWRQPQLSRIWDDESQHHKVVSTIKITGTTTICKSGVLPLYKEDRSWKPKRPRQIAVEILSPNDDDNVTITATPPDSEVSETTTASASSTVLNENIEGRIVVLLSQQRWRKGRKQANGVCIQAIHDFEQRVKSTYTSPDEVAGQLIFCTISPGKRQGSKKHKARIKNLRIFLKYLAEIEYEGLIGIALRLAFSENSKIPHYHLLAFLPQGASIQTCSEISNELFTKIDRKWRQLHGFGISKHRGWSLLKTGADVKNVIDYVCKDELNHGYVGSWGQSCFFYGNFPEPPAEVIEVTPEQAKAVIGILLNIKGDQVHPWKVNVAIVDVHPRLVLMALMVSGVSLKPHVLSRYRAPW